MFMDRTTQYCQDISSYKLDLQFQYNPQTLFYAYQQTDSKIYVVRQKTQNSQYSIAEEQSQKTDTIWLWHLTIKARVIKKV